MPRDNEFVNYVLDQLAFLRGLNARAMFGGHGLYRDEVIFAIIVNDMLYLKANDETRGDFEARGLSPFSYTARGKTMTMQYYEAPAEVFEDVDAMRFWTDKALQAALAAKGGKRGKANR
ncbi:MAG: TfoX/Sxy family protein [Gallionellaceae bacterium]|nr:TfoX/Sxy family protein [Gallionellaceae bacterium]